MLANTQADYLINTAKKRIWQKGNPILYLVEVKSSLSDYWVTNICSFQIPKYIKGAHRLSSVL